jgi:hypothetical protein
MPEQSEASTTDRLAAALRNGSETRRFVPALTAAGEFFERVAPHSVEIAWNEGVPAPADVPQLMVRSRGDLLTALPEGSSRLTRSSWVRRFVRLLLYPWLAVQQRFNDHVCEVVQYLVALHARQIKFNQVLLSELQHPLETTLLALQAEIAQENHLQGRLAAQLRELQQTVARVLHQLEPAPAGAAPELSRPLLEEVFLHAHLPAPPARILFLGYEPPLSVSASGYEVDGNENAFDAVVASPEELGQAMRRVRQGGRLLLIGSPLRGDLEAPFRVVKTLFLVNSGSGWSFGSKPTAEPGTVLIVAERRS